jgi:beta-lactamase superfamily II metal-dependent hydrolase
MCMALSLLALGPAGCRKRDHKAGSGAGPEPAQREVLVDAGPAARGDTHVVHVVDVGTGLAVFVEGPDYAMLYDGGSNDDLRDERANRLIAYLRAVRPEMRALDHVLLSHAHRDHVELLADVVGDYEVKNVWEPGVMAKPCAYQRFVHAIAAHPRVRYHTAASAPGAREVMFPETSCKLPRSVSLAYASRIEEGASVTLGRGASMTFLHVDGERRTNYNENSLVVRLDLAGTRVLLPGDAEAGKRSSPDEPPSPQSVEGKLLARHAADLRSDVLVVGHHGSMTSSRRAFIDAVAPSLAVISSGPHSYDKHTLPDREVVELLAARTTVLRTDADDGACALSPAKIGRDADGRPGGCDNVRITIRAGEKPSGAYFRGHD